MNLICLIFGHKYNAPMSSDELSAKGISWLSNVKKEIDWCARCGKKKE